MPRAYLSALTGRTPYKQADDTYLTSLMTDIYFKNYSTMDTRKERTELLTENSTKIAYRCPYCGCIISADVNMFMLSGGFRAECIECHKSALEMSITKDMKVRLKVPCLVCPHTHPYTVSAQTFFSKDIFILSCSFSGLDICFIGDEDKIEEEIDRTESIIMDLLADNEDDEQAKKESDMMVADTNVVREVLFALDTLVRDKKITCGKCGGHAVKIVIDYDAVHVVCKVCGNEKVLPARNKFDASAAIDLEELNL